MVRSKGNKYGSKVALKGRSEVTNLPCCVKKFPHLGGVGNGGIGTLAG